MPHILLASWSPSLRALYFDPLQKLLTLAGSFSSGISFNWLSRSPTDPYLIAASSASDEAGQVRLFRLGVEGREVKFEQLGVQSTGGGTAHNLVLEGGGEVVVANYKGGSLISVPITAGALAPPKHPLITFPFTGPGPKAARQESSHPHQVYQLSDNELLIPDLGADKVWRLGRLSTSAEWTIQGSISCEPGVGPRHLLTASSDLYILNELANSLSHYTLLTSPTATATHRSTQPSTKTPGNASVASELLMHPAGTHLYATNRDADNAAGDSIAIFSLSPTILTLGAKEPTFVKEVYTGLKHLRGALLHEYEGTLYLLTAGMKGGGVKIYEVTEAGAELVEVAMADVDKVTGFIWL